MVPLAFTLFKCHYVLDFCSRVIKYIIIRFYWSDTVPTCAMCEEFPKTDVSVLALGVCARSVAPGLVIHLLQWRKLLSTLFAFLFKFSVICVQSSF